MTTRARFGPAAGGIAGRALMLVPRVPSAFVPSMVFPLVMLVAFSGAFGRIAQTPGFPTRTMPDWILPMSVVQGGAFGGMTVALTTARDLESGFFDRFLTAPIPRSSILAGLYMGSLARSFMTFPLLMIVGLVAGAHTPAGPAAIGVLLLAMFGAALASTGWGVGLAFRFKSTRAAPMMQMPIFLAVFLSTAQVPLILLSGWLHSVAKVNPVTEILDLSRQGFIGDITWAQTWPGLLAILGLSLATGAFAVRSLAKSFD